jgi:hypothetical protein
MLKAVSVVSTPGYSLSVGRAVSLLVAIAPAGSHLSRYSTGVSHLPLQLTSAFLEVCFKKTLKKQQSFRKEPLILIYPIVS